MAQDMGFLDKVKEYERGGERGLRNAGREILETVLDFIGLWLPSSTDKFKKLLNEDETKALNWAYSEAMRRKAELDSKEAARLEKHMNDIAIWSAKAQNTTSNKVRNAHNRAIKLANEKDAEARRNYNKQSIEKQIEAEKLYNAKENPESVIVGGDLRSDVYETIDKYKKGKEY